MPSWQAARLASRFLTARSKAFAFRSPGGYELSYAAAANRDEGKLGCDEEAVRKHQ
jgi:hypothetical protein